MLAQTRPSQQGVMHIDIHFDVACPWCFVGKRRLERALALRPGIVATRSWRAFQLNPDMPSEGVPRRFFLEAKFGGARQVLRSHAAIANAGRAEGIEFAFERIQRTPSTLRAHRLIRLAAAEGRGEPMVEELFRAYFIGGVDIGDSESLVMAAARLGFERGRIRSYLAGEDGIADVLAEEQRARQLGIHAVPCFVIEGGFAISGAHEPEMFLPLFDLAASPGRVARQA
ncbi:MAG TPA: DsbA family oxidoreductase [Stellaceae bacterium]|jgi:predicted DsbA family dithiol-disulfide isomerase|nr:DsbA family oxidoreductase [Stellaceae bacterium]